LKIGAKVATFFQLSAHLWIKKGESVLYLSRFSVWASMGSCFWDCKYAFFEIGVKNKTAAKVTETLAAAYYLIPQKRLAHIFAHLYCG